MTDKLKTLHENLCVIIVLLCSFFLFWRGLYPEDIVVSIPYWVSIPFGWSGLYLAMKMGEKFEEKA